MIDLAAYRAYWHPIALVDEISDKPRRFVLLGENLVAFRTSNGVSVLKDLCAHRGCALSIGRVVNERIECPYHGWQYDHTGECVRIPAVDVDHPIPKKARVTAYQTQEVAGVVWVALEDPLAPVPMPPPGCEVGTEGTRTILVKAYDLPVDAGRAVENFLDVSHFPFVHNDSIGERDVAGVDAHELHVDGDTFFFEYPQVQPGDPSTGGDTPVLLKFYYHAPFNSFIKREVEGGDWSNVSLFLTPTSETTCRLFNFFMRNFDLDESQDGVYRDFIDGLIQEDMSIMPHVEPAQMPIDLRDELHIAVPDAASIEVRRALSRIQKSYKEKVST